MATETVYATSVLTNSGLDSPTNALGAPDGVYTTDGGNSPWSARFAIGDPSGALAAGATHNVSLYFRKSADGGGNPGFTVELWENGTLVKQIAAATLTTNSAVIPTSFTTADLSGDGTGIEILVGSTAGGELVNVRSLQMDAVAVALEVADTYTATISQTLPALTQTAVASTVDPTPTWDGIIDQVLPALTQTAVASTVDPPPAGTWTAVIAQVLPALTQTGRASWRDYEPVPETLYADAVLFNSGLDGATQALGAPNGQYTVDGGNSPWEARFSIGNPTRSLVPGATHSVAFHFRKSNNGGGGNPEFTCELWENGALVKVLAAATLTTNTAVIPAEFTTEDLTDPTGANVEIRIGTAPGGQGLLVRALQVDAIAVTAQIMPPPIWEAVIVQTLPALQQSAYSGARDWPVRTETLYADAVVANTALDTPNNALGAPNSTWTTDSSNSPWDARFSMANPSLPFSPLSTHTVSVKARKSNSGGGGAPTYQIELWEAGAFVKILATGSVTTNTATLTGTFVTEDLLGDGDDVEIRVSAGVGGEGLAVRTLQIDALWVDAEVQVPVFEASVTQVLPALTQDARSVKPGIGYRMGYTYGYVPPILGGVVVQTLPALEQSAVAAATVPVFVLVGDQSMPLLRQTGALYDLPPQFPGVIVQTLPTLTTKGRADARGVQFFHRTGGVFESAVMMHRFPHGFEQVVVRHRDAERFIPAIVD